MMEIRQGRSFASPLVFHAGQLRPYQSQIYPMPPKMLDLGLDASQNAIDLLNRGREPDRHSVECLRAFLAVHQSPRGLGYTG